MNSSNTTAVVHSYAKVNLALDVLGKRPDGYHAIESVMQTIGLHDVIRLSIGGGSGIRITCDMPGIPVDESNLAYKAADMLFENLGISPGVDIRIEKRIPSEAGLGGGSSNGAAVIRGLNDLLRLSLSPAELCEAAARVGSDVPFFLIGGTAFVRGRGESVCPMPDISETWMVVVKPPFGVSTAWAYRRIDEMRTADSCEQIAERETASARMNKYMETASSRCVTGDLLRNDLELPAVEQHPEIGGIKKALLNSGACGSLMCGSGSAVFGLFKSEEKAAGAASKITPDLGRIYMTRTVTRAETLQVGLYVK